MKTFAGKLKLLLKLFILLHLQGLIFFTWLSPIQEKGEKSCNRAPLVLRDFSNKEKKLK